MGLFKKLGRALGGAVGGIGKVAKVASPLGLAGSALGGMIPLAGGGGGGLGSIASAIARMQGKAQPGVASGFPSQGGGLLSMIAGMHGTPPAAPAQMPVPVLPGEGLSPTPPAPAPMPAAPAAPAPQAPAVRGGLPMMNMRGPAAGNSIPRAPMAPQRASPFQALNGSRGLADVFRAARQRNMGQQQQNIPRPPAAYYGSRGLADVFRAARQRNMGQQQQNIPRPPAAY